MSKSSASPRAIAGARARKSTAVIRLLLVTACMQNPTAIRRLEAGYRPPSLDFIVLPETSPVNLDRDFAACMRQICTIARPLPICRMLTQACADWIQMQIVEFLSYELRTPEIDHRRIFLPNRVGVSPLLWRI